MSLLWAWIGAAFATPLNPGLHTLTIHSATRAKIPFFGWTPSVTRSVVLINLAQTDGEWRQTHTVCDIQIDTKRIPVRTIIPKAFVQALPIKQYSIQIEETANGLSYSAYLGIDNVGMRPEASAVPTHADHPDVVDMEGDGHPGATVHVKVPMFRMAHLYVSQRSSLQLNGFIQSDGSVEGRVFLGPTVQHTLDASNLLLKSSPPIQPDAEKSWFRLTSYDGLPTCEAVISDPKSMYRG